MLAVDGNEHRDEERALELDRRHGGPVRLELHAHGGGLLDLGAEVVHLELDLLLGLGDDAGLPVPVGRVEPEQVADVGLGVEGDPGEGQALAADELAGGVALEEGARGGEEAGTVEVGQAVELGHEVPDLVLGLEDDDGRLVARDALAVVDGVEVGGDVVVAVEGGEDGLVARHLPLGGELEDARHAVLVHAERLELDREALLGEEVVHDLGLVGEHALERQRVCERPEGREVRDEPALVGLVRRLAADVPGGHEVQVVLAELDAPRDGGEAGGSAQDGRDDGLVAGPLALEEADGALARERREAEERGGSTLGEVGDGVGRAHVCIVLLSEIGGFGTRSGPGTFTYPTKIVNLLLFTIEA